MDKIRDFFSGGPRKKRSGSVNKATISQPDHFVHFSDHNCLSKPQKAKAFSPTGSRNRYEPPPERYKPAPPPVNYTLFPPVRDSHTAKPNMSSSSHNANASSTGHRIRRKPVPEPARSGSYMKRLKAECRDIVDDITGEPRDMNRKSSKDKKASNRPHISQPIVQDTPESSGPSTGPAPDYSVYTNHPSSTMPKKMKVVPKHYARVVRPPVKHTSVHLTREYASVREAHESTATLWGNFINPPNTPPLPSLPSPPADSSTSPQKSLGERTYERPGKRHHHKGKPRGRSSTTNPAPLPRVCQFCQAPLVPTSFSGRTLGLLLCPPCASQTGPQESITAMPAGALTRTYVNDFATSSATNSSRTLRDNQSTSTSTLRDDIDADLSAIPPCDRCKQPTPFSFAHHFGALYVCRPCALRPSTPPPTAHVLTSAKYFSPPPPARDSLPPPPIPRAQPGRSGGASPYSSRGLAKAAQSTTSLYSQYPNDEMNPDIHAALHSTPLSQNIPPMPAIPAQYQQQQREWHAPPSFSSPRQSRQSSSSYVSGKWSPPFQIPTPKFSFDGAEGEEGLSQRRDTSFYGFYDEVLEGVEGKGKQKAKGWGWTGSCRYYDGV